MPILEVQIVGEPEVPDRDALAEHIADAAAEVFGAPPGSTWVRLCVLAPRDYAENGGAPPGVRPVFVDVMKRVNPPSDAFPEEVRRLTDAVARAVARPAENVHVRYQAPGAGRQSFGGRIVD